jgi:hypothetical protein
VIFFVIREVVSVIQCISSTWEGHVGAGKAATPALAMAAFSPDWVRVEMAEMVWG